MAVVVNQLTKTYGNQNAVDDLSFEVGPGDILGFLGPNGAGKSTTMKIITCYLPPSSGSVSVCGYDVEKQSKEVRKIVGYLPENNPLYPEMYVKEYLHFIAGIHGIKKPKARIEEMIELTGLQIEQKKRIGQLSKGYRQRIGLAQAMIHDPQVLILDEPTSGLDPNQIVEIRNLIQQIGADKTVILSSHILHEVQAICNQIAIINRGELIAKDETANMQLYTEDTMIVTVEFDKKANLQQLNKIKDVKKAILVGPMKYEIHSKSKKDIRAAVSKFAVENDLTILTLQKEEQDLEKIFQSLTK